MTTALALTHGELDRYVAEVSRHPVLSREAELDLARRWRDQQDVTAAHELVVANLRFVVKVAWEYRGYGLKLLDLVQEGNIGLMRAVKKFDPDRGYRLISYAVWWIRAQIHEFIMRSWSLVKLGSGRLKRKLFFKLRSARSRMEQDGVGAAVSSKDIAAQLDVPSDIVSEMELRMAGRDFSLDAPIEGHEDVAHIDALAGHGPDADETIDRARDVKLLRGVIAEARSELDDKERDILEHRLLTDEPETLADIGRRHGVSRERARQIESKLLDKLRERTLAGAAPLSPTAA
jgi:RNA polymerase sigma-32 factor